MELIRMGLRALAGRAGRYVLEVEVMDAIETKALALLNECAGQEVYGGWGTFDPNQSPCTRALCRAIERHEAFAQEVSDAVEKHWDNMPCEFGRFVIAKPDPLVEALTELHWAYDGNGCEMADELRKALAARGLKIVEVE